MIVRDIRADDIPALRALGHPVEWTFGADYLVGKVAVDASDRPIGFLGSWLRAECHSALDPEWGTPAMRLAVFHELHGTMERELKARGIGQVLAYFEKSGAFCRRLRALGWVMSEMQSWHRRVG